MTSQRLHKFYCTFIRNNLLVSISLQYIMPSVSEKQAKGFPDQKCFSLPTLKPYEGGSDQNIHSIGSIV